MNGVTIKDVAADAGVSTATVSHVINPTRYVSDGVSKRVQNSIDKLNYYPNMLVGSLKGKGTYTIGMIIPSITNETFGKMAELIQTTLFDLGYNLIVCNTSFDTELEERALNTFLMKKVDAVIAVPANSRCEKLEEIAKTNTPVILVDRILKDVDTDTVVTDNYKGQYELTSYLIRMGHKNIGYVDRLIEQSHSSDQRKGYLAALSDNGIEPDPENIINANGHYYKAGMEAGHALMQKRPLLTAIACYYDPIAFGVMRGLTDLGYRIPDDVSVVGYDNMLFAEATWPALTTAEVPVKLIAEEACRILKLRLEENGSKNDKTNTIHTTFPPALVIRESVKRIIDQ